MEEKILATQKDLAIDDIKNLIFTVRGKQVIIDSDVARLYNYKTKRINETIKRNIERFPIDFCFKLTSNEYDTLKSQFATSNMRGGKQKLPYVFTEKGVLMLSGLLKNEIAIEVSIRIIEAFVEMRKFISSNRQIFERLTNVEYKLLEHDKRFDEVFNNLQLEDNIKQRIFFDGQIYEAYSLIIDIIKKANKKILIIDNYIDDSILKMLAKKKDNVQVVILTSNKTNIQNLDIQKFNKEYPMLKIARTNKFHDRFIVIDNKEMYHLGASIKDLGKKCFGINKIEDINIIERVIYLNNSQL